MSNLDDDQRKVFTIVEAYIVPVRSDSQNVLLRDAMKAAEQFAGTCFLENLEKPGVPPEVEIPRVQANLITMLGPFIRGDVDKSSEEFRKTFTTGAEQLYDGMKPYCLAKIAARGGSGGLLGGLIGNLVGNALTQRLARAGGDSDTGNDSNSINNLRRKQLDLQRKRIDIVEKLEDVDRDLERVARRIAAAETDAKVVTES